MQSDKLSATRYQAGQTLIETIVALFVMTTGLSSGLALATFAFGSSSDISEKITATGLAREGIEITRRMRDSNWLPRPLTPPGRSPVFFYTPAAAPPKITGAGGEGGPTPGLILIPPRRTATSGLLPSRLVCRPEIITSFSSSRQEAWAIMPAAALPRQTFIGKSGSCIRTRALPIARPILWCWLDQASGGTAKIARASLTLQTPVTLPVKSLPKSI